MHRPLLIVTFAFVLASVSPAQAQTKLRIETIKWPEVDVRAGGSLAFKLTGKIHKGDKVVVRGTATPEGFLEIQPPPGSVSWIPKAVVTKVGNPVRGRHAFVIDGDPKDEHIPVRPGGPALSDGPVEVQKEFKVPRGTIGYLRGDAVKPANSDQKWYPIDPLPQESRWIPALAIVTDRPADALAGADKVGTPGQLTSLPAKDATVTFRKAEAAEKAGNYQEAIELYQQVARDVSATNDTLANYCATRVYELRQRNIRLAPGSLTGRTANSNPGPGEPPLPGTSTFERPPPAPAAPANLRSTGLGYLRRAGFMIDNKTMYAMHDRNRMLTWYVTAEPGVDLEPYVDRWVELHGTVEVRGEVRGGDYMRVAKVMLAR